MTMMYKMCTVILARILEQERQGVLPLLQETGIQSGGYSGHKIRMDCGICFMLGMRVVDEERQPIILFVYSLLYKRV